MYRCLFAAQAHSYASTQVDVPDPMRGKIMQWAASLIQADDLAPDGLETDPHITVKYGLVADSSAVAETLSLCVGGVAMIGQISCFQTPLFDVLHLSIASEDLATLNQALSGLPHIDTHSEYAPHLTLAYLQPGAGGKYVGQPCPFSGLSIAFNDVTYSGTDGVKTPCPMAVGIGANHSDKDGITRFSCCGTVVTSVSDTCREGYINGEPWIEKRARLFVAGTYSFTIDLGNGKTQVKTTVYGTPELDKMAASVIPLALDSEDWDVPLQLDHEDDSRETVGSVRSAERIDNELWGWVRVAGQPNVANVKACLWRKLSIGHNPDFTLAEVSFTPFPRVLTAQIFSQTKNPKEDTPVAEASKDAAQPQPIPVQNTAPTTANFDASAIEAKLRAEFAANTLRDQEAANARFAALEAQNAEFAARNEAMTKTLRFAEMKSTVEQFSSAGQTTPAMREPELALLESFSDEQIVLYRAVKAAQPKLVDLSVYGTADSHKTFGDDPADPSSEFNEGKAAAANARGGK